MPKKIVAISGIIIVLVLGCAALRHAWLFNHVFFSDHMSGKTPLTTGFPLKPGYALSMAYRDEPDPHGRLFARQISTGTFVKLYNAEDLMSVVDTISTKEQALALADFFTATPTRHLLKTLPYLGIAAHDVARSMTPEISALLTEPSATLQGSDWIVERDVLLYQNHRFHGQDKPAQFVRSYEVISHNGVYTFAIGTVLAEGDEIEELLPYSD